MVSVRQHVRLLEKSPGWFKRSAVEKGTPALNKRLVPPADSENIEESDAQNNSFLAAWAESFIFAGSSSILLLLASLLPDYWYFSFFALVPFLYKIINASPSGSLRLGFLFGISFFAVSLTDSFAIFPNPSLLKLFLGTGLFAFFGWSVGWAKKRWGFYPSVVAILWIGLELGVMKLGVSGGLFERIETSNPILQSLITLLGFLTISVIIVFLNSLLVLAIVKTIELTKPKDKSTQEKENRWLFFFTRNLFAEKVYVVPEGRAPPLHSIILLTETTD